MAPVPTNGGGSSSMTAKDQLWTFQLRKENKAMLQEIRNLQEQRQIAHAEFEGSIKVATDHLAKVDARVTELEQKHWENVELQEKFREEIAALQSKMAETMTGRFHQDEARYILEGGKHTLRSVPNTPDRSPQRDNRPADPRQRRSPQMDRRLAEPRPRRQLRIADRNPSRGEDPQIQRAPPQGEDNHFRRPPPRAARRTPAQAGPVEPHHHATRSRSRREPPTSSKTLEPMPVHRRPITPTPAPPRPVDAMPAPADYSGSQIPHLEQSNRSMREYYAKANSMYQALQDVDTSFDFDVHFVGAFLRGIESVKARDKLVDELRQLHPSKVMENKRIDIMCEWEDVEDAIHRAGLFVEVVKAKRQGRFMNPKSFMNPRTMVETDI